MKGRIDLPPGWKEKTLAKFEDIKDWDENSTLVYYVPGLSDNSVQLLAFRRHPLRKDLIEYAWTIVKTSTDLHGYHMYLYREDDAIIASAYGLRQPTALGFVLGMVVALFMMSVLVSPITNRKLFAD